MTQQSTLGGSRDIMALRSGNTSAAAAIDAVVEILTGLCAAYKDYSQEDLVEMGQGEISADDAYWLSAQYHEIPTILSGADVQALVEFADKTRDISR